MAVSKALYKSTTLRTAAPDMGALMTAANAEVSRDNPQMLFVTVFAGLLDLDTASSPTATRATRTRAGSPGRMPRSGASSTATARRCAWRTDFRTGVRT